MNQYPVHKEGDIEWSCVDASEVMTLTPPPEPAPKLIGSIRGSVSGPRWADLEGALKELEWFEKDLKVRTVVRRGWIREIVLFELKGPVIKIRQAQAAIDDMISNWNTD
jgi:hypothetical protein